MSIEKKETSSPVFNIKAVVKQTGLKPATIRSWERRYGLPSPHRSKGGHRQYSQQDVDTLIWLVDRQNEGLTISHAISLWRFRTETKQNYRSVAEADGWGRRQPANSEVKGKQIERLRQDWIDGCLTFDRLAAEHAIAQAFALYSP